MKNHITLHEAIVKVLLAKKHKTASYDGIAKEIEIQNLFPNRKRNIPLSKQVYLRTSISSSKYKGTWFEITDENSIKLVKK